MKLKAGVDASDVQPPIWFAIGVAEAVYRNFNRQLVVTSLRDGQHQVGSRHYQGLAADFRTNHLIEQERRTIFGQLKSILDFAGFDVVMESDHFHVESDPHGNENWCAVLVETP
jgi:hypothetical protein